jgi:hypothetical protein
VSARRHEQISSNASVLQRIEFFAEVMPLNFSQRISLVTNAVNHSGFYLPWQKLFLSFQFNHLLDAIGLTLMNFRSETEDVLKGLEQFGRVAQAAGAEIDPANLSEMLLARSSAMSYVHQGIAQIVALLPTNCPPT